MERINMQIRAYIKQKAKENNELAKMILAHPELKGKHLSHKQLTKFFDYTAISDLENEFLAANNAEAAHKETTVDPA